MSDEKVIIFTDGAAKGNPGRGGWGAIIADAIHVSELGGGEAHTTNNRMELSAVLEALTYSKKYKKETLSVHTDSQYVINGATKWGSGWQRSGWITRQKKAVLNRDLWQPLLDLVEAFGNRIEWHYVGGHVGVAGNERADRIADAFARGEKLELYQGARKNYLIDVSDLSFDAETKASRTQTRSRSNQKAYSYISLVDGNIVVHKTWLECETRVKGKMARFKKALTLEEEKNIIKDFTAPQS